MIVIIIILIVIWDAQQLSIEKSVLAIVVYLL